MEYRSFGHGKESRDGSTTRRLTEKSHIVRVTTEFGYILLNPVKCENKVEVTIVSSGGVFRVLGAQLLCPEKAKHP